jgi:alkylation response protein AidB-like acyl-CoA dehydrogenase
MFIDFTDEEKAFREEIKAYLAELVTPEVRAALDAEGEGGETYRKVVRKMGADGMLGAGWPVEFGGGGRSALEQFVLFDEIRRARAPFPFVTVNTVGPTLMRYGSQEQIEFFLPKILAGEVIFAIGYTEPEAGTDLASLATRAVRDGDSYVINGSKVFTSGADMADYVWLACRTDPDAPKHQGISILIVPTSSPGFKCTVIRTVGELLTSATYYDDVRVPVSMRVGEENDGWRMITTQLNHERVGLSAWGGLGHSLYSQLVDWARETPLDAADPTGPRVIDQPWVRIELARVHGILEAVKLMNWKMASSMSDGSLDPAESSAVKVFGTERLVEAYHLMLGIVGEAGTIRPGSPGAVLQGEIERAARGAQINTFGGGVNEVQREIVAWMGLGMARGNRR